MSNIDFDQMVTAQDKADKAAADHIAAVKAECSSRIYAVLNPPTVSNIQGAAISGELSAADMDTFRAGRLWVDQMLVACRTMVLDPSSDYRSEASWPAVPEGVNELAARY
ncbi:hypothetical protein [Thalassococcus sp. S3]|uniref:hypothetical protein n=1 Tax=Thalassococcus sp. S3 TaxID=2017482 RepID=UPI00102491F2|nr:hypothetical protein [Thalassococcus sp. S3]QBF31485.1 hypothetical protein CFI11_09680 [Thalassococcus sp. S3]